MKDFVGCILPAGQMSSTAWQAMALTYPDEIQQRHLRQESKIKQEALEGRKEGGLH